MPFSIKDALLSWQGAVVGKKRKKTWKATPLCFILDLMEREKPKAPTRCLYLILLIGWAISETRELFFCVSIPILVFVYNLYLLWRF